MDMDVDHELERNISRRELRLLLLHEFRLGRKATEATSNICSTMGKDVLSIRTAQHWFHRFKNGNFELDDLPHTQGGQIKKSKFGNFFSKIRKSSEIFLEKSEKNRKGHFLAE